MSVDIVADLVAVNNRHQGRCPELDAQTFLMIHVVDTWGIFARSPRPDERYETKGQLTTHEPQPTSTEDLTALV